METRLSWMRKELDELKRRGQHRTLSVSVPAAEPGWIERDGVRMLDLASNHYLGLPHRLDGATLERWLASAAENEQVIRTGSTASRLIVGGDPALDRFEREFAAFKGTKACLVFGSGYLANVGIISALVGRSGIVFSDRLNHASIVDGAILSRAELVRYRHRDTDHLEALLRKADPNKRKLIVTDAVFSMDGSLAPLGELALLKERYGAMLMVDEAHSGGVYGDCGEGLTHALGLTDRVDIQMGTFGKAYGSYGAYAAGDSLVIEYLVNKARSVIFSTALPPMVVHAIRDQWETVRTERWRRNALKEKSAWLRAELRQFGFDTGESESHIIPLIVGGNEAAVAFARRLQAEGVAAVPIRPPTVPEGTARIRLTPMATHRIDDLRAAVERIRRIGRELGVV